MTFEQIPTEYAYGKYAGADYGSRIRILMRSPTAVMYVASGVSINRRGVESYAHLIRVAKKANRASLSTPEARAKIIEAFGEGADKQAIRALGTRGQGTILVDGGGEALPLPRVEASKLFYAAYDAVTPTRTKLLPVEKKCRQCGADLRPQTRTHHLGHAIKDDHPKTPEDCQRLSNWPVFAVSGYDANSDRDRWPFIDWFETWDGESYVDDTFCDNKCAARYGRRAAQDLPAMEPGIEPVPQTYQPIDSINHYDPPPPRYIKGIRIE